MQYPVCLAQGWPIGSGAVESGNKVVVEARLKGAGMHWAHNNVNRMLALRNALCSDRWAEARSQVLNQQHLHVRRMRQARRERHLTEHASAPVAAETLPCSPVAEPTLMTPTAQPDRLVSDASSSSTTRQPWRPDPKRLVATLPHWQGQVPSAVSRLGCKKLTGTPSHPDD